MIALAPFDADRLAIDDAELQEAFAAQREEDPEAYDEAEAELAAFLKVFAGGLYA